jgi:iron(III) transport system substrate-binding protein
MGTGRRGIGTALLCAAALAVVAGCGEPPAAAPSGEQQVATGSLDQLIEAAKREGQVVVYTADNEDIIKLEAEAFRAKYGIEVNYVRALTDPLNARIKSEHDTGVNAADFLQGGSVAFVQTEADYFRKLDSSVLPGWDDYPEVARGEHFAYVREEASVIQYNTDLVPADRVPESWEDMLDPFWKDHLLLTDPKSSESYLIWAQWMVDEYGIEWLEKLRGQNFQVAPSGTPAAQQLAAGTAYASFPARPVHSAALRKQGAPIAYTVMGGADGAVIPGAVFAKAPHPNAALLFLHWLISKEGVAEVCKSFETMTFYNIDGKSPDDAVDECLDPPADWAMPGDVPPANEQQAIMSALGL